MRNNNDFRLTGKTLKLLRVLYDYQASELAELLKVHRSQILHSEAEKRSLTRRQTLRILEMFDISEQSAIEFDKIVKHIEGRAQVIRAGKITKSEGGEING